MSMILLCESESDLSVYYRSYGVIKCRGVSPKTAAFFDLSKLWTVENDFFDEMVTDAYSVWFKDKDSHDVLLTEFLDKIMPVSSQIAMFWATFDKDDMTCFDDRDKFREHLKETILSDYKCMFNCWYRDPLCYPKPY